VNDSEVFKETLDAFRLLDIGASAQTHIFSLIAAVLHLGNVQLVHEKKNESSCVARDDESIRIVCELLKVIPFFRFHVFYLGDPNDYVIFAHNF
jgi:myosin-5